MIKRRPVYPARPLGTNKGIKRRKLKTKAKKRKLIAEGKFWNLKKADKEFSLFIRSRDGKCLHPKGHEGCSLLQNSHFIGRANKNVRFDPENCDSICWFHHYKSKDLGFEYQKQTIEKHGFDGQYTLWKKAQLGPEKYSALIERSKGNVKQKHSIINCMKLLASQPPVIKSES